MESRLIEALADCLERMASGAPLEDCLRRYPAERAELEPLLRASATLRSVPVPPPIDLAAVEQVALARAAELRAAPSLPNAAGALSRTQRLPDWVLPALLAVLLIALIAAVIALIVRPPHPVIPATATPTGTLLSTDTPVATPSVTITLRPTHTPTVTPSPTGVTVTPSATVAPTATAPPPPPPPPGNDDDGGDDDGGGGDDAGGGDDGGGDDDGGSDGDDG